MVPSGSLTWIVSMRDTMRSICPRYEGGHGRARPERASPFVVSTMGASEGDAGARPLGPGVYRLTWVENRWRIEGEPLIRLAACR